MKKILSLALALVLTLSCFAITTVAVEDNVYCYIAASNSVGTVLDGMQYTTDTYATAEDALNAAFEDFASVIGGRGDRRICLAKDIVLTTPFAPQPSVKKASYLHLNGHSITYSPTSEYVDTSAITINNSYFSKFVVYANSTADGSDTFVNGGNANFFSTGLTGANFAFNGSFKSDFNYSEVYFTGASTVYGNITTNNLSSEGQLTVNGDVTTGAFWSGNVTVTVTGDYTCKGRTYPQGTLKVDGDLYANTEAGHGNTFKVNTTSSIIVGGNAYLNCKTNGNLFDTACVTPKAFTVAGTTTLTGAPANVTFRNATLTGGLVNNTTNNVAVDTDDSVIIGGLEEDGETTDVVSTVEGASIRLNEVNGMRFSATFNGNLDDVDEMGIIIAPNETDIVGNYFTMEDDHIKVVYDHKNNELWADNTFVGSIVNVADRNLARDFIARAYVVIDDITYYAKTTTVRNLAGVADAYIADTKGGYTELDETTKALVDTWASKND